MTEYSYKHSLHAMRGILHAAAWEVREVFTSPEQPMRLWLCEPREPAGRVAPCMAKSDSPLVIAATEFDEVLAVYSRLGELFLKTPLTTLKHLERANQTLGELADSEQRLQDAGKKLIEALSAARQKQEQLSQAVIAHAPTLQARNTRLRELMTRWARSRRTSRHQHARRREQRRSGRARHRRGPREGPRAFGAR